MADARPAKPAPAAVRAAWLPTGADPLVLAMLVGGFALLYLPTYWDLAHTIWASDEQGHGPIILAVSLWLLFQLRHAIAALPARHAVVRCCAVCAGPLAVHHVLRGFLADHRRWPAAAALPGLARTAGGVVPAVLPVVHERLPGSLVASVTGPLKSAVSYVASNLLYEIATWWRVRASSSR
ncbi:MAG: archaeosortase/exosortase family protein [Burkholderiaceae bacterium]